MRTGGLVALLLLLGALACGRQPAAPEAPSPAAPSAAPQASSPRMFTDRASYRLRLDLRYKNPTGSPASVTVEVPLPKAREDYQEVEILSIDPEPARETTDEWGNRLAVLELRDVPPGGEAAAEVTARVTRRGLVVDARAGVGGDPGPALDSFLRPEENILADDPVIRKTAEDLVAGEPDPYYRLVRLYDFVRTLDFQLEGRAKDDHEVLRSRVAQCADAAGLLVSLSRSLGIPARYVAGVYLRPEEPSTRTTHAWAEAYLPTLGWLPLDPTMGRFGDTRLSRLAQLESPYLVLWEGRGSRGLSASGPGSEGVAVLIHHEVESREHAATPVVPVPPLAGSTDPAALVPAGRAGSLLDEAIHSSDPFLRARMAREALELAPDSMALYKLLVTSTPAGAPREDLAKEIARRREAADSPTLTYASGLLALEGALYSKAEQDLRAAGDSFPVRHALADLYVRTHQPSRAAEALEQATSEFVTRNLVEEAAAFYQDLGDEAGVADVCAQALKLFPGDPGFRLGLAQASFRLGRREEADREFGTLRREDLENGLYAGIQGALYLESGDRARARALLQEALKARLDDRDRAYYQDLADGLGATPPQTP